MYKKILIFITILCSFILVPITSLAKVPKENVNDDKNIGTASTDKERAIEAGKMQIGTVNYLMNNHARTNLSMLTYDYANDSSSTGGLGIDCSEFVARAFSLGYGIQWGSDSSNPPNTHGLLSGVPNEYKHSIKNHKEAKRGDIVFTNGFGHVVIALGDGMVLGSNGSNDISTTSGPSIQEGEWMPVASGVNVIRLPDSSKDAIGKGSLQKGHPSDNLKATGNGGSDSGKNESSNETFVGEDAWKNRMINFQVNTYENTFKGIETGSTGFISNAFILNANKTSNATLEWAYIIIFTLSIVLFFFMFSATIFYLVILPNGLGGQKVADFYEKTTGIGAYVSRENTMDILARLGITTFLVACIYANLLPLIISGIIKLITSFTFLF